MTSFRERIAGAWGRIKAAGRRIAEVARQFSWRNFFIGLDQWVNTWVYIDGDGFGWPDESLSSRAWRLRDQSNAWKVVDRIFFFDPEHCRTSYEAELNRMHSPVEQRGRSDA